MKRMHFVDFVLYVEVFSVDLKVFELWRLEHVPNCVSDDMRVSVVCDP